MCVCVCVCVCMCVIFFFCLYFSEYVYKSSEEVQNWYDLQVLFSISSYQCIFCVTESCESIKGTARKFGIPEATLRDRVKGRIGVDVTKSGKDPLFTLEEERALFEHLKVMSSYGYGYSRSEVVYIGCT